MAIPIQLYTRIGKSSFLSDAQIDANWNAIKAAFAAVNNTSGSVTSVSATSFSGISVNVTNPTTTPAIALTTTLNGFLKGNGSAFSAVSNISLTADVSGVLPILNGGTNASSFTTNRAVYFDGTRFVSSSVTNTELGYLSGVTGAIQTQLNGKEDTITSLPYTKGGLNGSFASRQAALDSLTNSAATTTGYVLTRDGSGNSIWAAPTSQWTTSGSNISFTGGNVGIDNVWTFNNSTKSLTQSVSYAGFVQNTITNSNATYGVTWQLLGGSTGEFTINTYGSSYSQAGDFDFPSSVYIATGASARWSIGSGTWGLYGSTISDNYLTVDASGNTVIGKGTLTVAKSATSTNGTLSGVIYTQTASTPVADTIVQTSLITSGIGSVSIPANRLTEGMTIRYKGSGIRSGTASPDITIRVKLAGNILLTTGAVAVGNVTDESWSFEGETTIRTVGASANAYSQGIVLMADGTAKIYGMPNTAVATIDTTSVAVVDVTAQWSAADPSNTIVMSNFTIELLG